MLVYIYVAKFPKKISGKTKARKFFLDILAVIRICKMGKTKRFYTQNLVKSKDLKSGVKIVKKKKKIYDLITTIQERICNCIVNNVVKSETKNEITQKDVMIADQNKRGRAKLVQV